MKLRNALPAALLMALPALSWAAGPNLVGTFSGTAKINSYSFAGVLTKSKVPMTIEIAADDSTTLTIGSSVMTSLEIAYGDANGILLGSPALDSFRLVTFSVKNTSAKGFIQGADAVESAGQVLIEGKFKLKKAQ